MPHTLDSTPSGALTLQLQAWPVALRLPDADTDVLIFDPASTEGQLGALIGDECGRPQWVNAQGLQVLGVTHWADMPQLVAAC